MSHDEKTGVRVTLAHREGFRFRVRFGEGGHSDLVTDEPAPLGAGSGPNPAMLLAAAVGTCLASSLRFCLEKARLETEGLEVEIETKNGRNEAGRLRIERIDVRLVPTVSADVRARMRRCLELFEAFCLVTESVRAGIDVRVTVEPAEAIPAARPQPGRTGAVTAPAPVPALAPNGKRHGVPCARRRS